MAKKADVVVLVGGLNKNHFQDGEGGDRLEYGLPFGQDELIEALLGVNTVSYTHLCFGTAIRSSVSVTRVTTHNWVMSSNFMIKRARKVL